MTRDSNESSIGKTLRLILFLIASLTTLVTFVIQILEWVKNPQTLRVVSVVAFFIVAAIAIEFAHKTNQQKWRWRSLAALYVVSCLFFLWVGSWIEPRHRGCADYGIQMTSPLSGARVTEGVIQVSGSYRGNPPAGSIVVITRSPDGLQNWPSSTAVETNPILGVWKGVAALGGEPPLSYNIAVAVVGRSGRALIEYYYKIGQETGQWPSIEVLPDDIEICDQVSVTKE